MAITNLDTLFSAMKSGQWSLYSKASIASQLAANYSSLWRAVGQPGQAAIPTTAAVCNNTLLGAMPLPTVTTEEIILASMEYACGLASQTLILEDRLAHMGGLSGILTTEQTVGVDASVTTSNLPARVGATNYSELKWWIEWYTTTGTTARTATCAVTYHDNTSGTIVVTIAASYAASRRLQIVPTNGKYIKSIQTLLLSGSTGTQGNFGVTSTKEIATCTAILANKMEGKTWDALNAPVINPMACLNFSTLNISTATQIINGKILLAKG